MVCLLRFSFPLAPRLATRMGILRVTSTAKPGELLTMTIPDHASLLAPLRTEVRFLLGITAMFVAPPLLPQLTIKPLLLLRQRLPLPTETIPSIGLRTSSISQS